ncbi:MAG: hypothetical protein HYV97_00925 [Bdellovibrio sp.]|nr:hypothetical protein [Bdellovibrio sp.]
MINGKHLALDQTQSKMNAMYNQLKAILFIVFLLTGRLHADVLIEQKKSAPTDSHNLPLEYESFFPLLLSDLEINSAKKELQDNRLNRFLMKRDKRGYFNTPYIPYSNEPTAEERKDGKRRMGRFFNKWMMTAINEKYGIFQRTWRRNGNGFVSSNTLSDSFEENEGGLVNKLKTEISYRLRTDRTEVEFRNELCDIIGRAYYQGGQEVTVKKYFDGLGLETFYYLRPGRDTGEQFAIEKSLPYYLKAKTSYGKERAGQEEPPISSARIELLYNGNF